MLWVAHPACTQPQQLLPEGYTREPEAAPAPEQADVIEETTLDAGAEKDTSAEPFEPELIPLFGMSTDEPDDVRQKVGAVRFEMAVCGENSNAPRQDERVVRGYLSSLPTTWSDQKSLINGLLSMAAHFAWQACPHAYLWQDEPTGNFHYDVHHVELYGPDEALLFSARLGGEVMDEHGDQWWAPSRKGYLWLDFELAPPPPEAQPIPDTSQTEPVYAQPPSPAPPTPFPDILGPLEVLAGLGILIWLLANHEAILCFFYSLKPHPAKELVDSAIQHGSAIDGELYDQLTAVEDGNRYLARVRDEQAQALTARLRKHEAALRAEEAQKIAAALARTRKETERLRAHVELRQAGISHEDAAARLDEARRATRTND